MLVAEGETDGDGKALFKGLVDKHLSLVVEHRGKFLLLPEIENAYSHDTDPTEDVLILDRSFVRPGEALHMSGINC